MSKNELKTSYNNKARLFLKDEINPLKEQQGKTNHLAKEEKETKLKRRTILFSESERNTKLFHKYTSHTRNINIIWENNKPTFGYFVI